MSTERLLLALVTWLCLVAPAAAQGFNAAASPPRFELRGKPGDRLREVIEISNAGVAPAKYRVRTADWTLGPDASVNFFDELQPGSCRPWVAIERAELGLPGGARARYRFEVAVPADAPVGECRFALLIEGDEPVAAQTSGLNIPVRGQLGVIVYVAVGGAAPKLEVVKSGLQVVDGKRVPTIWVRNTGNAHGRVGGFLGGVDAKGRDLEFTPLSFPVLPGETRALTLNGQLGPQQPADPVLPVRIQGTLEWAGGSQPFDQRFE